MAQVNSSNYGYNLPVKYVGADYYSLNRTEAELSLHEKDLPSAELIDRMARLLGCRALSVTDGKQGAVVKLGDDFFSLPTLSTSVVDTIGCGDAYFALSSLAACLGLPARLVGARRQHRRRRDDAAPLQRAPRFRAGVHDDREDRHLTRWTAGNDYVAAVGSGLSRLAITDQGGQALSAADGFGRWVEITHEVHGARPEHLSRRQRRQRRHGEPFRGRCLQERRAAGAGLQRRRRC